jgi:hypothetical protein
MQNLIVKYSEIQAEHYSNSSYLVRAIFRPIAHAQAGEPIEINNEAELPFFCDTNQTGRTHFIIETLLRGLTESEFQLLKLIVEKVYFANIQLKHPHAPISSLLMHLYQKRLVGEIFPNSRRVFTVGPGSGYLELLLALDPNGYTLFTTDVNKSFYIYQIFLYSAFNKLNELFEEKTACLRFVDKKINHIPWWHFKDFNNATAQFEVDLIVCNHAICEMHPLAVKHLLSFAQNYGCPSFLLEGTGAQGTQSTMSEVISIFRDYDYFEISTGIPDVFAFCKRSVLSKRVNNPIYNKIRRVVPFLSALEMESFRIQQEFKSSFLRVTSSKSARGVVFVDEIMSYYQDLTGVKSYKNYDERFLFGISPKGSKLN